MAIRITLLKQAVAVRDELGLECLRQLEPPVPEEALSYLLPVSPSDRTASLEEVWNLLFLMDSLVCIFEFKVKYLVF